MLLRLLRAASMCEASLCFAASLVWQAVLTKLKVGVCIVEDHIVDATAAA